MFGCVYRKGTCSSENTTNMMNLLTEACKLSKFITICGDFNFPSINWTTTPRQDNDTTANVFLETLDDLFLTQHVKDFTRKRGTDKPSTLDLVLTDHLQIISKPVVNSPFGKSDHGLITWKSTFRTTEEQKDASEDVLKHNFYKGNYKSMKGDLSSINWELLFSDCKNIEDMTVVFEKVIKDQIDKHVPLKKVNSKRKRQCPWVDYKALKAIRRKHHAWKRFQKTKSHERYMSYVKERNKVSKKLRKAKKTFEKKIAKEAPSNPKAFFGYVNSYKKKSTSFIRLKKLYSSGNNTDDNQKFTTTDKETADELNAFFVSVFTKDEDSPEINLNYFFRTFVDEDDDSTNVPFDLPYDDKGEDNVLSDIEVSEEDVFNLLRTLDPNKSAGDDEIHPRILKECAEELTAPLCMLFKKSIEAGTVPLSWKLGTITPLHKSDERDSAENYRPISLTSQVVKLLEKLIRKNVMDHLLSIGALSDEQHGFREKKSCMTNVLEALEFITKAVDDGLPVDEIFLDFKKAFDKVNHELLLYKLDKMGIKGNVLSWISSFLNDRMQRVRVNGSYSSWTSVTSGVPQGSVLGPLLFLAFINDMPSNISTNCKLFADDSKIYGIVDSMENIQKLQDDLNKCYDWSKIWKMDFHPTKCKILHFGHKNGEHQYNIGKNSITPVNFEKDLGIIISDDLKWTRHVDHCVTKANRMIGILKRTFSFMDKEMFLSLYKTFVRPHLEYCPEVWNPYLCKDINTLENVQRRATKIVPELKDMSYEERLSKLKLFPLQDRRARGDMISTYKLLNGYITANSSLLSHKISSGKSLRSHNQQLWSNVANTNTRNNFFTHRVVLPWNTLSINTVNSLTVETFKARYDRERLSNYININ